MVALALYQMRAGDELGSFPGHRVPRERNLEQLFGVTPRQIAAFNGVDASLPIHEWTRAIEGPKGMLEKAGSRTFTGIRFLTDNNTRLYLPLLAKPPRVIVKQPQQPGDDDSGGGGILAGLGLAGLGLWAFFGD